MNSSRLFDRFIREIPDATGWMLTRTTNVSENCFGLPFARRDVLAEGGTIKVTAVDNNLPADQPNDEYFQRRLPMATVDKKRSVLTGFNFSEKECIWMRAKVVPTKYCDNAFDCTTCRVRQRYGPKDVHGIP